MSFPHFIPHWQTPTKTSNINKPPKTIVLIHLFIQNFRKKRKIQETLQYTFGDSMSKIHRLNYRCEKTLRPQIQSLKEDSLVIFFFFVIFDYFFPQSSSNEHRFCESIKSKIIVVDQGPLRRYRNANHKHRGMIMIDFKLIAV